MPIDTDTISYLSLTTLRTATPEWIFKQIGSNDAAGILNFINNKANDPYLQISDVKKEILNTKLGPLAANGAATVAAAANAANAASATGAIAATVAAPNAAYGGRKTKKVNSALKSWVEFVKKISKEENISYPKAMKRASKRKSEWKRGGHGELQIEKSLTQSQSQSKSKSKSQAGGEPLTPSEIAGKTSMGASIGANIVGGTRKRRGSRKSRGSRRR
jgi:hypothetical protein